MHLCKPKVLMGFACFPERGVLCSAIAEAGHLHCTEVILKTSRGKVRQTNKPAAAAAAAEAASSSSAMWEALLLSHAGNFFQNFPQRGVDFGRKIGATFGVHF